MFKILKNLKSTIFSVITIILLLCLQAGTDLALPDYTSKIVNIGIQQGGIENAAPEVIRVSEMQNLLIFSEEDEFIRNSYTLISKGDEAYIKKYPEIKNEDLYILNNLKNQEQEKLNIIISKPIIQLNSLNNTETENTIKEQILTNMPEEQKVIMQQMSVIDIIKSIPEEQKNIIINKFSEQINQMPETILQQAAIEAVKNEYSLIGIDINKIQNNYIFFAGLQMLGIALISMLSAVAIILLSSRVAARLGKDLRNQIFEKVLKFSTKEFREYSTASLITRSTNDIQQIQGLIAMLFRVVVYAPIIGIGGIIRVINKGNTSIAWIIGATVLGIVILVLLLFIIAMPKFKKLQELIDKLNLVSREILTGIPVIRAFNTQKREEERFKNANKELMDTNIFINRAMSIMMPGMMLIMNCVIILIIWVGGHSVETGIIQVGDIMAFIQYAMQIIISFLMISLISIMLPRAAVSAKRINEVLSTEPNIKDKDETKTFDENKKGLVELKNVSFRYPDGETEVLSDISFTAKPGETTAIIGSTGSGKSTIVNLIPRFYDVTGGELLVDGVNVKDVPQKELRKKIGYVPQKGILFSGTIESNIKYGNKDMSDKQMEEVANIAQAEEFINLKAEKYNSEISQGGNNVSGGQKQRLSIARAIAINPEILIFDDSFSALDLKTDRDLREALSKQTKEKTVIIVAQRISTILNADQIIVLDEGKIVGIGTHKELIKNNETYKEIALSQLSEDELGGEENARK